MDWQECNEKGFIKEVSKDNELIKSLKVSAQKRFDTAERLDIDETTAATVVTLFYDSLRELLEAKSVEKGYKIYNHDCYCAFLKEIEKDEKLGNSFDRFRRIRNGINYYGKDIDVISAKEIVEKIKKTLKTL